MLTIKEYLFQFERSRLDSNPQRQPRLYDSTIIQRFLEMFPDFSSPNYFGIIEVEEWTAARLAAGQQKSSVQYERRILREFWNYMIDRRAEFWDGPVKSNPFSLRRRAPETFYQPPKDDLREILVQAGILRPRSKATQERWDRQPSFRKQRVRKRPSASVERVEG